MWMILLCLLSLGFLGLYVEEYRKRRTLQEKIDYMRPIVNTMENVQDFIYYCETYPKLNYLYLSPSVDKELDNRSLEDHLKNPEIIFDLVHPEDHEILMRKKEGTLDFTKPIIVRLKNSRGEYEWYEDNATPVYRDGKYVAVAGVWRNINEKVMLQKQLEYKAHHDALTDVYSRAFLKKKIQEFNELIKPIAVVIADIDDLKKINDQYGHHMGDLLVKAVADCLKSAAGKNMIVSRIGGDEFAVLMPNSTEMDVKEYIYRVQGKIKEIEGDFPFPINVSIGYKCCESSKGSMLQLLREADKEMYQIKKMKKIG